MKYTKNIEIPVDNLYRKIPILVKQNDYNSRFFSVKLTANGAALTSEAFGTVNEVAIGITRGDKQKKAFKGSYNATAGTFTLPLPKWAVERAGDKITFDVMVIGTNANGEAYLLRSALVEAYVQAAGYGSEDVSEDESVEILTGLIADVVKLEQDVRTAEAARVQAEQARATDYARLSEELGEAIENINEAAENVDAVKEIYAKMQITLTYDEEGYPCAVDAEE